MKNKFFDTRLYREGLRQLRLMGILFTLAAVIIAIYTPLSEYVSVTAYSAVQDYVPENVTGLTVNPLIILAFCIVAPFLTLNLFSFLNKRESSDFYHNIPVTRTCLFFSFFAAVITWLLIYVVASSLISTAVYALLPQMYIVNYLNVFQVSLSCFIGGFSVAAAVAIAMSVSGTMIMNILLALIIIFLPRTLLMIVLEAVTSLFPLVEGLDFLPLLDTSYNIPAGSILGILDFTKTNTFTSIPGMIYTTVLGIVYTGVALILFRRRRSEGAGHSAPTPRLQALYRFLIGFTISSIVTVVLFVSASNDYLVADELFAYLFLYGVAVLAVIVFEILCTRRFKGLVRRCAVTVVLLIVANAALAGAIGGVKAALVSYSPTADEITSVKFLEFGNYASIDNYPNYFNERSEKIAITDPTVRRIVSEQLRSTLDSLDKGIDNYYNERYEESALAVSIQSGGIAHKRYITISDANYTTLMQALSDNSDYQQLYMKLPQNFGYIRIEDMTFRTNNGSLQLFNSLQEEVRNMGFAKWYSLLNGFETGISYQQVADGYISQTASSDDEPITEPPLSTMYVYIPEGSNWTVFSVPLYPSVLPKTCAAYLELCSERNKESATAYLNALSNVELCFDAEICLYNAVTTDGSNYHYFETEFIRDQSALFSDLSAQLRRASVGTVNSTAPFVYIAGNYCVMDDQDNTSYNYARNYYTLNDEALRILNDLIAAAE